jgi:hypothetical protein
MKTILTSAIWAAVITPLLWLLTLNLTATVGSALIVWGMVAIIALEDEL